MKQKKKAVKTGIYRILRWSDSKNRWIEPKKNKYEAEVFEMVDGVEKRRFRPFRTVKEAEAARAGSAPVIASGMSFGALVELWKTNIMAHLSPSTQGKLLSLIKHFDSLNEMAVTDITTLEIDNLLARWKSAEYLASNKGSRLSFKWELKALNQILTYYGARINRNYMMPILPQHRSHSVVRTKKKQVKDLSIEQVQAFYQAFRKDVFGTPFEGLLYLAASQYMLYARVQEVAALEVEDILGDRVRLNKRVIWPKIRTIPPFIQSGLKSGDEKVIASLDAATLLLEWARKAGIRSGRLFDIDGQIVTYRQIQYRYDRALKRAGLPFKGTHLLRHASLTEHYATGKDILQTKLAAGHSDLATTQVYAKARESGQNETQALMDSKLSGIRRAIDVGNCGN